MGVPVAYRLGLKDPRPGAVKLRFASYLNLRQLPTPPDHFGHADLITNWGMLGNGSAPDNPPSIPDGVGDCGLEHHSLGLEASEVHPHDLPWLEHLQK